MNDRIVAERSSKIQTKARSPFPVAIAFRRLSPGKYEPNIVLRNVDPAGAAANMKGVMRLRFMAMPCQSDAVIVPRTGGRI